MAHVPVEGVHLNRLSAQSTSLHSSVVCTGVPQAWTFKTVIYWSVCTGVRGSTSLDFQNAQILISMYRCERFHKPGLSKRSHVDQYVQVWEVPHAWTFKTVTCWSVCTGVRGSTSLCFIYGHILISSHEVELLILKKSTLASVLTGWMFLGFICMDIGRERFEEKWS